MTYIVSSGALYSTHSLTPAQLPKVSDSEEQQELVTVYASNYSPKTLALLGLGIETGLMLLAALTAGRLCV